MGKLTRILAVAGVWAIPLLAWAGEAGKAEDKGFFVKDGDFTLETEFWVHMRADYLQSKYDFSGELFSGFENTEIDPKLEFRIKHARAIFGGKAFFPWLSWKLQTDFGKGQSRIRDAWVQIETSPKNGWRIGQFKSPFDIYKLTSASYGNFTERPGGTEFLWPRNRDVGVMYYGSTENKRFNWKAAVQNGNGDNQPENDNNKFMTTVRVEFQNEGGYAYKMTAIDHPDKLNYTVGLALMRNPQGSLSGNVTGDCELGVDDKCTFSTVDRTAAELFGAVRGKRWQATTSLQMWTFEDGRLDQDGTLSDADFRYWNLDFGFFVSERDELLARIGQWEFSDAAYDGDGGSVTDSNDEWRVGYSHYFSGNNFKFTVDYGQWTASDDVDYLGASGTQDLTTEGLRFLLAFQI